MKKLKIYIYFLLWSLFIKNAAISTLILIKGYPIIAVSFFCVMGGLIIILSIVTERKMKEADKIINDFLEERKGFL